MNSVLEIFDKLDKRNYVRKGDPEGDYWFDWKTRKLQSLVKATDGDFYFIVHGSPTDKFDFYIFPFNLVKDDLTEANQTKSDKKGRHQRWIGLIHNDILKINNTGRDINLTPYKGNVSLLERASGISRESNELSAEEGDSGSNDNNDQPFVLSQGDERPLVFRLIKARRGQQSFRNTLRNRYGDACLISGCDLMDIVEAAHIKPFRGPQDNHSENGLLLRSDLHTLFDLDLLGIDPNNLTISVHPTAQKCGYEVFDGVKLRCNGLQPSNEVLEFRWRIYLRKLEVGVRSKPSR